MPIERNVPNTRYAALRLNTYTASAWAVVAIGSGAIATDRFDRLIMRLSEDDARRIAAEMTERSRRDPTGGAF